MIALMTQIVVVWLAAIMVGFPLFAAMGLAAFAFTIFGGMSDSIVAQKIAQTANSFPLLAAPLFILMGNILNSAGITQRIFDFATAVVGWMRGGLCHANIIASVIFSGMSGSAVADAAGVGTIEIKAMKDEGYDAETAAAITAASATIGPIIPPSLPMVIYGVTADVSIGGLFLAGVVPGLLMAASLMAMVTVVARRRNLPRHKFPGIIGVWKAFRAAFWALMTPVVLFGGMIATTWVQIIKAVLLVTASILMVLLVWGQYGFSLPGYLGEVVKDPKVQAQVARLLGDPAKGMTPAELGQRFLEPGLLFKNPIDKLSYELLTDPAATFRFDASDLMPAAVGAGDRLPGPDGIEPAFIVVVVFVGEEGVPGGDLACFGPRCVGERSRNIGEEEEVVVALASVIRRDVEDVALEVDPELHGAGGVGGELDGGSVADAVHDEAGRGRAVLDDEVPVGTGVVVPGARVVVEDDVELGGGGGDGRHLRQRQYRGSQGGDDHRAQRHGQGLRRDDECDDHGDGRL
jgi:hypothetical protein